MLKTIQSVSRAGLRSGVALALIFVALVATAERAHAQPISVVVHSENPISDITVRDLGRIFLGQTNTFPGIGRIRRFEHESARELFYQRVTSQSLSQIDRQWNQLVFSGSAAAAPVLSVSASSILRSVAENPGSIAILPTADANALIVRLASEGTFVKTLSVGGANPADAAYPIQ
jgi:hypothetical protein